MSKDHRPSSAEASGKERHRTNGLAFNQCPLCSALARLSVRTLRLAGKITRDRALRRALGAHATYLEFVLRESL
jgi:hypothetical protein